MEAESLSLPHSGARRAGGGTSPPAVRVHLAGHRPCQVPSGVPFRHCIFRQAFLSPVCCHQGVDPGTDVLLPSLAHSLWSSSLHSGSSWSTMGVGRPKGGPALTSGLYFSMTSQSDRDMTAVLRVQSLAGSGLTTADTWASDPFGSWAARGSCQ